MKDRTPTPAPLGTPPARERVTLLKAAIYEGRELPAGTQVQLDAISAEWARQNGVIAPAATPPTQTNPDKE